MLQENLPVIVGASTSIVSAFGFVLFIVLLVAFLWGTIKVIQGAANISRGDAGVMDIVGGVLIAAAPLILWQVFSGLGYSGASGLDPTTASNLQSH